MDNKELALELTKVAVSAAQGSLGKSDVEAFMLGVYRASYETLRNINKEQAGN